MIQYNLKMHNLFMKYITFFIVIPIVISSESFYTSIYKDFEPSQCFLRLNKYGETGCQSTETGTLHEISSQTKLSSFTSTDIVTILIPRYLFTSENINELNRNTQLAGILIYNNSISSVAFDSPEYTKPQYEIDINPNEYSWNPKGNGLMHNKYNFGIALIESEDTYAIFHEAALHNSQLFESDEYPIYAVEFKSRMYASLNSYECLKLGRCLPIGGYSVWSLLGGNFYPSKPIVIVTTQIDSDSMFPYSSYGADTSISGIISLLTAAETLTNPIDSYINDLSKQILFTFFNGEKFGYLGSRRFLSEITNFVCKDKNGDHSCNDPFRTSLDFTKINSNLFDSLVEFNQVGHGYDKTRNITDLFIHSTSQSTDLVDILLSLSKKQDNFNLTFSGLNNGLPPSSSQSFYRNNISIPIAVITDHFDSYKNKYYNSDLDKSIDYISICQSSTFLSRFLYVKAGGNQDKSQFIFCNCSLVIEMIKCLTEDFSCTLVKKYLDNPQTNKISFYPGVFRYEYTDYISGISGFIHNFISKVSENRTEPSNEHDCKSEIDCNSFEACTKGKCRNSVTFYHPAYDQSLEYSFENAEWEVISDNPNTYIWTESTWPMDYGIRLFKRETPTSTILMAIFGVISVILSCLSARYWTNWCIKTDLKMS